jgi:tRNA pseudouridine55 synthase
VTKALPNPWDAREFMVTGGPKEPTANGFLNFRKPVGITSMDALRRVKRITGQRKKVGHAGTLDPLAAGVLPICFGQATRLMEQVVAGTKRYRMTVRLGAVSDTYDAEGDITRIDDAVELGRSEIAAALQKFVGVIDQVPPMYSAIKIDGRRLYDLARAGKEVTRPSRQVVVRSISIDEIALPYLGLSVECGKGVYLRSIAHDLGQALGCGGYVSELNRLSCGGFWAADAVTLEVLEHAASTDGWRQYLQPVDWALRQLPAVRLGRSDAWSVQHGQAILASAGDQLADVGQQKRAYDLDGVFLALLDCQTDGLWRPTRVFHSEKPSPYAPPSL